MKNTLVVNLVGPPGSGKSTMAANIFARLKWLNIDCELINEFAKDLVWEERQETLKDQIYVFAKQFHKIFRLNKKVDVIITDSPLILSMYYNSKYRNNEFTKLNPLVIEQHNNFRNINFFLNRVKKYNPNGRNQTEEESNIIGKEIKEMLDENFIEYKIVDGTEDNVEEIVKDILVEIGVEKNTKCWNRKGCIFNSNFPSYKKCLRNNYSVEQCKIENNII